MAQPNYLPPSQRDYGFDLVEPKRWPCDEGVRRAAVVDPNWGNRVVRHVGWRACMHCTQWMWSDDVRRVRLHTDCANPDHDL
jgi:hypothetical protein